MYLRRCLLIFFIIFLNSITPGNCSCGSDLQQRILNQIFADYNKDVRPPPGENATLATANAAIINIPEVDEKNHRWKIDLFFRLQWNDPRLQYSNLLLPSCKRFQYISLITEESFARIWKPNLFFTTELEGSIHSVLQPNVLARIFPNGDVLTSVHAAVTLSCTGAGSRPGELMCPMALYSYGLTTEDLVLRWLAKDAIQIERSSIVLEDYVLGEVIARVEEFVSITGRYTKLITDFHFIRKTCMA